MVLIKIQEFRRIRAIRGNMKKKYIKPNMEVMNMECGTQILSGSGDSYWVPPEEKEGCATPWHCDKWGDD